MREGYIPAAFHFTKIDTRDRYMAGKAAVKPYAVAGHLLIKTPVAAPRLTKDTLPAGHNRRDNNLFADKGAVSRNYCP